MAGLDLLPYLIAADAAGTGATTLVLTAGDNGGWPALAGDTVIVAGGSGGAQATGVTDTQGSTYSQPTGAGTSTTPASWIFTGTAAHVLKAPGPGVTADQITVTWAGTGQAKQVVVMGCQHLGAVDAAVTVHATGTSTAPSATTGIPAQAGELIAAVCLFQNAGGSITWAPGWKEIAHITSGANAIASLAVMVNPAAAAVSPGGTLSGSSVAWSMTVVGLVPAVQPNRGVVGASVFKGAYPGLGLTDTQAKQRHDRIVGRTSAMRGCKRYLDEDQYESATSPGQNTVALTQSGIQCLVSLKPTRAVGGGVAGNLTSLRTMITYWKNNGVAPLTLLWNESNLGGKHGPFGDGTNKGISSPYGTPSEAQAASNYLDYFAYHAPTVTGAGLQCFYNPCLASPAVAIDYLPPRFNLATQPAGCTGMVADFYMTDTSATYPLGTPYKATLDDVISAALAATPPYPVGVGETGVTDGSARPLTSNPAGAAQWIDDHLTAKMVGFMAAGGTGTIQLWFANGTGNVIDDGSNGSSVITDPRAIAAYQRWFDTLDVSVGGTPTITTATLPAGTVGNPYTAQLSVSGGTSPYTWAITAGALPAGLSLGATTGKITGTPTGAGTASFTAQVTDNLGATATAALSITIAGSALAIPAQSLPPGTTGTVYATSLSATGGSPPYTWAVTAGALPAGLSLASNGTITGTPTAAGTASFTAQVTDNASATATRALSITVTTTALQITTTDLPAAAASVPYHAVLAASGGTPPYTWSLLSGSLPPGVALGADGTIGGIPAGTGLFTFTAQAADSAAATATAILSVTVTAGPLVITPGPWRFLLAAPQPDGSYLAEVIQAASRTITLRTEPDQNSEASFDVDGRSAQAAQLTELQTDLQVLYGPSVIFCGRIAPSQDTITASAHRTTVTAIDYREVLRRRAVLPGDTLSYTSVEQSTIAWDLIQATQARAGGNLGITRGVGKTTTITRTMTFALGDYIGDDITQMAQLDNGFEWQITPYGQADLRLDVFYPQQGTDRGVVLSPGDARVSSLTRNVDPSAFADSVYVTGDSTKSLTAQALEAADIATRPEGRWDQVTGTSLKTQSSLNDGATQQLATAQVVVPAYTIVLYPGTWRGPSDIWIGDTVTLVIASGRLAVQDKLRVVEMSFAISADGVETLTMSIGAIPLRLPKKIAAMLKNLRFLNTR
jgi:Putative Ig domain